MNDEEIAKNKPSMKITDGQFVSWGTVKGTILNYIKKYLASAIPNTEQILTKLENEYSLSGQSQHELLQYRNSVSGIINKISGKGQDWPSSSIFSYKKGNRVILITLAGVIEYDKSDVKQTPTGEAYIKKAKVNFFNGISTNVSICGSDGNNLTHEQLASGDFNGSDIRLFPAVPENTYIKEISNIKKTTYELSHGNKNKSGKYYLSIEAGDGISISNLDDNNIVSGSLSYRNNTSSDSKDIIKKGNFVNFMPYGDEVSIGYSDIDGKPNTHLSFQADGCGGLYKDDLSVVNVKYIVNNFIESMSNEGIVSNNNIATISKQFHSLLTNFQQTNIDENEHDYDIGDRNTLIHTLSATKDYYHIQTLFNGKYTEQIVKHDNEGNYVVATKNLKRNATDSTYEAQLGNGNIFIGTMKIDDETGDIYFMNGKFLNRDGKVVESNKQISLKEALSLSFEDARSINENDLSDFKLSDRIIINEGENGYDFTIVGTSFENTVKNDKVFNNYLPPLEYINRQIFDVEEFIKGEMQALNNQQNRIYDEYIKQISEKGFTNELIELIRNETKKLFANTRENTYILNNGERLTQDRLSAFYSQLSQWQYLSAKRKVKMQEFSDNEKNDTQENELETDNKINNNAKQMFQFETSNVEKNKENIDTNNIENKNNHDMKSDRFNSEDNQKTTVQHSNTNLLKPKNNSNISNERYPKILNHNDLSAIFTDLEADQLANKSPENQAIFANIMMNVVNAENDKINLFVQTCKLLHESRGKILENGAKILPLSQMEYDELMKLNNKLTDSMDSTKDQDLCKQVQSYHIEITDEYGGINDDFNKSMQFALSGEGRINAALYAKNCKLFDELDKTGEIKRCCNDILYERDMSCKNINKKYSGYYNAYENQDSLNTESSLNVNSTQSQLADNII